MSASDLSNDHDGKVEDLDTFMDVMKDYREEEVDSESSLAGDIFDECSSEPETASSKLNRKKFTMPAHITTVGELPASCYQCTVCNSYFSHKLTARNHEFCASGQKPFKCKLCDKRFVKKCDRDNHYKIHSGERPFTCLECDKTFLLKHKLSRHLRTHSGVKGEYKCSTCPRSFINKEALRKHEVSKHNASQNLQCKKCKQFFEKQEERTKHTCIAPSKKNPVVCEKCGKTFSKQWNLTVHLRIHGSLKPYSCEVCQKSFRLRQHLERHSSKHQPDADFECTLCEQTFRRKDNMIRHLKLNHPDRHLGVDLNEIAKHSRKPPKVKLQNRSEKVESERTIILDDRFPNIRFAKKSPVLEAQAKPVDDAGLLKLGNAARRIGSSVIRASSSTCEGIRGKSGHGSGPASAQSSDVQSFRTNRGDVVSEAQLLDVDPQRGRQVSVLRFTGSQNVESPTSIT